MKQKIFIAITSTLLFGACSKHLYNKGVKNYDKMVYYKAIDNFESYLLKNDEPIDAKIKLANSYRLTRDFYNAEKWFSKIVALPESEPINMFYYAKTLMSVGKYDEAKIWLKNYLKKVPNDFVAETLLASCNSINEFKRDTTLYTLKQLEIPEIESAFSQTPHAGGIIFVGDKITFKKSEKSGWTGRSYFDIYFSKKDQNGKWLSPMELKGDINGSYHEGPICFTKDENVVYFTRNNFDKKKINNTSIDVNNLKIFRAELVDDKWTNISELPFNNDKYSCGHPSLSADNKTLYFVSDMPGGFGGTDIYKTTTDGKTWTKPENLGNVINTGGNEMFPYIHHDGTFYFSSDAHNSMGGLDVFMTYYDGHKWLQVENLNYPLNSSKDDFAFVFNGTDNTGYVSSNRNSNDKIYEVTINGPKFFVSGSVYQKGNPSQTIGLSVIEVKNETDKTIETITTDKFGMYKIKLKPKCEYNISASKPMFFTVTQPKNINVISKKYSENYTANFELDQIALEKPIVLENIYYDLDKWNIRIDAAKALNNLAQVMRNNPNLKIELSSHTDSRAGDQYNLILSDKRAKAALQYLVMKGIDEKRMKWKGYGETKLLNRCTNDVECSEEEHQKNRRTEFKSIVID